MKRDSVVQRQSLGSWQILSIDARLKIVVGFKKENTVTVINNFEKLKLTEVAYTNSEVMHANIMTRFMRRDTHD